MSARDELAREIFIADNDGQSREASIKDWSEHTDPSADTYAHNIADGLIAAGWTRPRIITTAEELAALPIGSRLAGKEYIFQRISTLSYDGTAWLNVPLDHMNGAHGILPAAVLYEPAP